MLSFTDFYLNPGWQSICWPLCLAHAAEMSNRSEVKCGTVITPLWSLHPFPLLGYSLIHVFVWKQRTVGAFNLPSPLCPWLCCELPCPAHHHRTTAYQDSKMTCNMSPDSRKRGDSSFILSLTATFFVSWLFNFPLSCFLPADGA